MACPVREDHDTPPPSPPNPPGLATSASQNQCTDADLSMCGVARKGFCQIFAPPPPEEHYLWFAFVCFLIRSPPPPPEGAHASPTGVAHPPFS